MSHDEKRMGFKKNRDYLLYFGTTRIMRTRGYTASYQTLIIWGYNLTLFQKKKKRFIRIDY